jgi:TonB family protein
MIPRLLLGLVLVLALAVAVPAAGARKPSATMFIPPPPPDFPSGYEPGLILSRLASPDSVDVARACGNLRMPWGFRGWVGRDQAMRSYGRRVASAEQVARITAVLEDTAALDTIYRVPGIVASCRTAEAPPIYLVRFHRGGQVTSALLRFDVGAAAVFADEAPLGMVSLAGRADSLWAWLGEVLEDDPALRRPVPEPKDSLFASPHATGEGVEVDVPPASAGSASEAPHFPQAAMKNGIEGTVWVLVRVNTAGMVEDAVVHSGHEVLRESALDIAWKTRFKPARKDGQPVGAWTMIPVSYTLH